MIHDFEKRGFARRDGSSMNYAEAKIYPPTRSDLLFAVGGEKQTFMNLLYLLISFPLGIFYFVFLIAGFSITLSSTFIISLPLLIFIAYAWQRVAEFERAITISLLDINIPPLLPPFQPELAFWGRFRVRISNPVMWKSLLFLLAKFPLGIFSFVLIMTLFSFTIAFLSLSLVFGLLATPILLLSGILSERKTRQRLLLTGLSGFGFGLISLLLLNGLASLTGQFARAMLGMSDKDMTLAQARAMAEEERARAARAEASRRALIVNVSHELRTPIASIRGHAEALLMETEERDLNTPSRETLQNYLTIIQQEAERLGVLVDDLLSLARSDADELRLDITAVDAGEIVEEVYQAMVLLAHRERQVTLVRSGLPGLPPVLADRQRLAQVLLNLIRNGVAYTPEGGIVSITIEESDANRLVITVADTGIGIPQDELDLIFERFYRVDTSRARTSGGFGLGLAIARDLVQAMGGSITVESKRREGSCFRVFLRIAGT
jgi:two-component system, OmpR family, phosphate regulon sensor histidine kinase PhoR